MVSAVRLEAGAHPARCHCGGVQFTVTLPDAPFARRCNCSICTMKGVVMIDVPMTDVTVDAGEDLLTTYTFGTGAAKHRFCARCGIHCFHQTRTEPDKFGVNAACLQGVDFYDMADVPVFDGRNHPKDTGGPGQYAGVMRYVSGDPD